MKEKWCYKCGAKATSKEHVPPLCIFPEQKDVKGDHRKNLITVPSCQEHNLKKSKDDEFLMACITGIVGNNAVGYDQTKTKVGRALLQSEGLIHKIIGDAERVEMKTTTGQVIPVIIGSLDDARLHKCIEQIACGLYFHEFGRQFNGEVTIVFGFANYKDERNNKLQAMFKSVFNNEVINFPIKGNNPKVFYYQVIPQHDPGVIALRITFFEGTDFFLAMKEQDAPESFDLGTELIKDGVKSIISYNGTDYEFN